MIKCNVFVTAQPKFGDSKDLNGFKDSLERDSFIINRWNLRVRPGDVVFIAGGFLGSLEGIVEDDGEELTFSVSNAINYAKDVFKRLNGHLFYIESKHDQYLDIVKGLQWGFYRQSYYQTMLYETPIHIFSDPDPDDHYPSSVDVPLIFGKEPGKDWIEKWEGIIDYKIADIKDNNYGPMHL